MHAAVMKRTAALLLLAVVAVAEPVPAAGPEPGTATPHWSPTVGSGNQIPSVQEDVMRKVVAKGCSHRYTLTCLKLDVVSFVDKLSDTEEFQVLPGVTVVRENTSRGAGGGGGSAEASSRRAQAELMASLAKDFPRDVDARVDAFLVRRVGHYLDTHAVNVKLLDAASATARAFGDDLLQAVGLGTGAPAAGTGRGKGGKKGMGAVMAMAMMMKGMMGAMGLMAIGAMAAKALMVGLMALTLSLIAALKGLSGGGGGKTTYEIVSKPVYSHEHSHSHEVQHGHGGGYGHSSYGRSFDEAVPSEDASGALVDPSRGGRAMIPLGIGPVGPGAVDVFTARDAHELAYNGYLKAPQLHVVTPATASSSTPS